ncbi:MAG: hypothetical protein N2114_03980 [Candidatus Goldbacteria bacterium]|nr:hypothetical protein [Candidatus Goldiibacteriota bacterium]
MNSFFTILKTGISCAAIISFVQALIHFFFIEKFEAFYKHSTFIIILLKIGFINLFIYLLFSFLIFNFFNYISGNFLSKSFFLMCFLVIFKTVPIVLNLFFSSTIDFTFVFIVGLMNLLSDIISAFVFIGMFSESDKLKM